MVQDDIFRSNKTGRWCAHLRMWKLPATGIDGWNQRARDESIFKNAPLLAQMKLTLRCALAQVHVSVSLALANARGAPRAL